MGSQLHQNLHETYGNVDLHKKISQLIRDYSSNKTNIYDLALQQLSFSQPVHVLDLGCGFGQFSGSAAAVIPAKSTITGIDLLESNRLSFLKQTDQSYIKGYFHCGSVSTIEKMESSTFDLILSGFSLYFFLEFLPEIARVLKPDGSFVAITHSTLSLTELLNDIGLAMDSPVSLSAEKLGLDLTLTKFNTENGKGILNHYFTEVVKTDYTNHLVFNETSIDNCLKYVNFKLKTISHGSQYHQTFGCTQFKTRIYESIHNKITSNGKYILNKNDAIFYGRKPLILGVSS